MKPKKRDLYYIICARGWRGGWTEALYPGVPSDPDMLCLHVCCPARNFMEFSDVVVCYISTPQCPDKFSMPTQDPTAYSATVPIA